MRSTTRQPEAPSIDEYRAELFDELADTEPDAPVSAEHGRTPWRVDRSRVRIRFSRVIAPYVPVMKNGIVPDAMTLSASYGVSRYFVEVHGFTVCNVWYTGKEWRSPRVLRGGFLTRRAAVEGVIRTLEDAMNELIANLESGIAGSDFLAGFDYEPGDPLDHLVKWTLCEYGFLTDH